MDDGVRITYIYLGTGKIPGGKRRILFCLFDYGVSRHAIMSRRKS